MSDLFRLTDTLMARLEPYFPKSHGKPRDDDRRVLSGIVFIKRNWLRRRDALREYGPHKTLYNRWKRWSEKGIFAQVMVGLAAEPAYPSQREDALDRSMKRVERLRVRLGWHESAFDGLQGKPKGLHWRTYDRLVDAIERENRAAYGHILSRSDGCPTGMALAAELTALE